VTWGIDYTSQIRADLVGLDADVSDAITELLVVWMASGPPRENARVLAGIGFYEAVVADRYLLGYSVKEAPARLALLWLRRKPGVSMR